MRPRHPARSFLPVLLLLVLPACGKPPATSSRASSDPTEPLRPRVDLLKNEIPPDQLDAVVRAHYQGLGFMERYEYREAANAFREVRERAPGWIPGSINLAIALLNDTGNQAEEAKKSRGGGEPSTGSANFDQAFDQLDGVLRREPDNAPAHYCKGIILEYIGKLNEAHREFEAVTKTDPADAHALYKFATTYTDPENPDQPVGIKDAPKLVAMFSRVIELNPYLVPAYYRLQQAYGWAGDRKKQAELTNLWLRLDPDKTPTGTGDPFKAAYGESGKYAQVVNPFPKLGTGREASPVPRFDPASAIKITLPDGDRWVQAADFSGPLAVLGRARSRFGATVSSFDADGDGRTDLFLAASVKGAKGVRDTLLLNRGDGAFDDVSAAWGLRPGRPSLGAAAGDFDADGKIDLFLCGPHGYSLYKNAGGKFAEVTAKTGMDNSKAFGLTARWLDLDQDGDLDLYVVNYTDLEHAAEAFGGQGVPKVLNTVFRNVGKPAEIRGRPADNWAPLAVAPPDLPAKEGLSPDFSPWPDAEALAGPEANHTGLAWSDFDSDNDLDLILTSDGGPPVAALNDRLGRFHRVEVPDLAKRPVADGLLVIDLDKDGRADVVSVSRSGPVAWRNTTDVSKSPRTLSWEVWPLDAKSWQTAAAADLDLDTWPDLVALPGKPDVPLLDWARNDTDRFVTAPLAVGPGTAEVKGLAGFVLADVTGDPLPDLILLPHGSPPLLARNLGNGGHWLALDLGGRWKTSFDHMRTNSHALGTRVTLEGQGLLVTYDHTTTVAGLGQSVGAAVLGLGKAPSAELVRLRWPDGTMQCELNAKADVKLPLAEYNRKTGSCPVLFTWNGSRFVCLGDFLGGGGLGYLVAPGVYSQPDRDESVAIAGDQLAEVNGIFRLSITEPMDEVAYLDRLRLIVVDRPAGVSATPDERFAPEGPRPSGKVVAWKTSVRPIKAIDLKGRDVTKTLEAWDRDTVDGFKLRKGWTGYAEDHGIILDFGDRLTGFGPDVPLLLVLAGWVEYPYSQTNYAAATAGVALRAPTIERRNLDGTWTVIEPHAGYPAGMPRTTTLDLTGKLAGPRCVLRIRTNMECYYDQAFIAVRDRDAESSLRQTRLDPTRASLGHRGYTREVSPDGKAPLLYDYDYVDPAPLALMTGTLTRYGDVLPLLRGDDDQFCLVGPGDEVRLEFDAGGLPPLPGGWTRSYVLEAVGYCKDADPFTATGDRVGPLPWRGMPDFPFGSAAERPSDPSYRAYLRDYQTRPAGGR